MKIKTTLLSLIIFSIIRIEASDNSDYLEGLEVTAVTIESKNLSLKHNQFLGMLSKYKGTKKNNDNVFWKKYKRKFCRTPYTDRYFFHDNVSDSFLKHSINKIGIYETIYTGKEYPVSKELIDWPKDNRRNHIFSQKFTIGYEWDHDEDGATVAQEMEMATDPFNPSTYGDGKSDGERYIMIKNGLIIEGSTTVDADGDNVIDTIEIFSSTGVSETVKARFSETRTDYPFITDATNPDTDGDRILDGFDPNPLGITDENGDGIADEWVMFWTNQVEIWGLTNISIADLIDGGGDADGDGILNSNEYANGSIPIVPNGYYETRIIPLSIVITAKVNEIISGEFSVVDLSFQPSTGEVFQCVQPWTGNIELKNPNYSLQFSGTNYFPARFYSHFGVLTPLTFVVDTTNLNDNTTYYETIKIVVGGGKVTNEFEVILLIGNNPEDNHAPRGFELLKFDKYNELWPDDSTPEPTLIFVLLVICFLLKQIFF